MFKQSIYIGYVAKSHGLYGTFSIKIERSEDFCQACLKINKIYTEDQQVLKIQKSTLNSKIFLKVNTFEIRNREQAKALLRKSIYIKNGEVKGIDTIIQEQTEFIGFKVIENNKTIGVINSIDYNRLQPLIKIKAKEEEIISIPYVKDFIIKINKETKEFVVQLPDGLIEICKH